MRRHAFITGAGSGIGNATTGVLLQAGYDVTALARTKQSETLLRQQFAAHARHLRSVRGDLSNPDPTGWISDGPPVDVLINNAGDAVAGSIEETSNAALLRLMQVNLLAPIQLVRAVLPTMRERGSGTILNVSSLSALAGLAGDGAYAASKAALMRASESLRFEVAPFGIDVCCVIFGAYATPLAGKLADSVPQDVHSPYRALNARLHAQHSRAGGTGNDPRRTEGDPRHLALALQSIIETPRPDFMQVVGTQAEQVSNHLRGLTWKERDAYLADLQRS